MFYEIKKNSEGKYQIKSSISDEILHDGWLSEDELKKKIIKMHYFKFIEEVIKIDMEFPSGYHINKKEKYIEEKHNAGGEFIIKHWKDGQIFEKYNEIIKRLDLDIK